MTRCLTDAELQAVVDGESPDSHAQHARACGACATRRDRLQARTDRLMTMTGGLALDDQRREAVRRSLQSPVFAGATTLREPPPREARTMWLGAALGTAAAFALIGIIRMVGGSTTVSAAEVLDRSRAALVAPTSGVEVLTYDLSLTGVLAQMIPDEQAGRFTVEERIDHDQPGRYRLVKLADGRVVAGAADDPIRRVRTRYIRAHGRGYLLRFTEAEPAALSILAVKRFALETLITLMQASGNKTLRQIERDGAAMYEIQIGDTPRSAGSIWGLTHARALVAMDDARLIECSATGFVGDQPFQFEFALRTRDVLATTNDADFEIASETGDLVLEGKATGNPMWDIVERALRGLPAASAQ